MNQFDAPVSHQWIKIQMCEAQDPALLSPSLPHKHVQKHPYSSVLVNEYELWNICSFRINF